MVSVLNRVTKELKLSVNTPDYPTEDWIHSPDLSSVSGVLVKYWKITVDAISEMNLSEKAVVDDADKQTDIDNNADASTILAFTTADRDAITTPVDGILIYNSTNDELNLREGGAWVSK